MAEEEIVIVENDQEHENVDLSSDAYKRIDPEEAKAKKRKIILIATAVGGTVLLLLIGIILYFVFSKDEEPKTGDTNITKPKGEKVTKRKLTASELEKLIEKAKILYDSGNKESALLLFKEISIYSEAVSNYNLGVAKMGDGDYEGALEYFKKSTKSSDNELPSAINSAVCLFKLGKNKEAREHLSLARASLPKYGASPLYSYYYALISYYEGNYYEALAAVNAPTGKFYKKETEEIAKRAYLALDDSEATLKILKDEKHKDFMTMGFLQARLGKYREAISSFESAKQEREDKVVPLMAQSLVFLKARQPSQASNAAKQAILISEENASSAFPIKVFLKERAFESDKIQNKILTGFLNDNKNSYSIVFYFAPYKIFNPNKTISTIRKGEAGLLVDDVKAGVEYLELAAKQSKINAHMIKGIEYALSYRVYLANKAFKELEPKYPTHSVLLYNLALSYAQSGDFREANKYFTKAYHFDPKNYEAGIFSILTSKILGINFDRIRSSLEEDLFSASTFAGKPEYAAMLSFALDNPVSALDWINNSAKTGAMPLTMGTLMSFKLNRKDLAVANAKSLKNLLPKDIVANGLFQFINGSGGDVKIFAKETQKYLNNNSFDLNSIYYGPDIARDTYVAMCRVSGMLAKAKAVYESRLKIENFDKAQLLKGYGTVLMYLMMFEEATKAYSTLIFDVDFVNAHSLFMAGASAIASGNSSDAISFFELSKLYDPANLESIYALGLLYQEAANLNQATSHFQRIKGQFDSEFFDFDIR